MQQYNVVKKIISNSVKKKIFSGNGVDEYFFFLPIEPQPSHQPHIFGVINGQKLALILRLSKESIAVYIDDPDTSEHNGYFIHDISWIYLEDFDLTKSLEK